MSFAGLLSVVGDIYRQATGPRDVMNQLPETFAFVDSELFAIQAPTVRARRESFGIVDRPPSVAFASRDSVARTGDQIRIRGGKTYRVDSIEDAAGRSHHKEAILVEAIA
jgi:hypothetical protein